MVETRFHVISYFNRARALKFDEFSPSRNICSRVLYSLFRIRLS